MGKSNLATRVTAIPYNAAPWANDWIISYYLSALRLRSARMRFCRPYAGDIITSKLTMLGTAPTGGTTQIRFYKGDFNADGTTAVTTYSEERITADHLAITGTTAPFTFTSGSTMFIDGLDLRKIIPKKSDSDFNADGFILGVDIVTTGDDTTAIIKRFTVDCTAQMGVL